ncbi:MAG: transcription termination factor NusA [Candidatus Poribacteria bacterium]|nr:transcription termination factor NusA [Candidatus Poribacteria bacterium]
MNDLISTVRQMMGQTELSQEIFIDAIESALMQAARRRYGTTDGINIEIDRDLGGIRCFVPKKVVDIMKSYAKEIPIEEARLIKPDAVIDEIIEVEADLKDFGRIEAATARQILAQKIKDAEKEQVLQEFNDRVGELVTGYVQHIENRNIILELDRTEGVLPYSDLAEFSSHSRPNYRRGDALKCLVTSVEDTPHGLEIQLSRAGNGLVAQLFELEVPEVEDGLVEIKAIARDPGDRSKVAVHSNEPGIDPVGTCVGIRGSRVRAIVEELKGEKIELIEWNADPTIFVKNSLQPAKIARATLSETEDGVVKVVVPDDQLSLAIGKRGQNVRLSARLTMHRIDIISETEAVSQLKAEMAGVFSSKEAKDKSRPADVSTLDGSPMVNDITEIHGIGPKTAETLTTAGFTSIEALAEAEVADLANVLGENTAQRIHQSARALQQNVDEQTSPDTE